MGEFFVAPGVSIARVSETVASQHSTGMDDYAIAQPDAVVNGDIRVEKAAVPDVNIRPDHAASPDARALADFCSWSDHGLLGNADLFAQPRGRMNNGARMNSGRQIGAG